MAVLEFQQFFELTYLECASYFVHEMAGTLLFGAWCTSPLFRPRSERRCMSMPSAQSILNSIRWGMIEQRSCRGLLCITVDCLSNFDQAGNRLTYDSAPCRIRPVGGNDQNPWGQVADGS